MLVRVTPTTNKQLPRIRVTILGHRLTDPLTTRRTLRHRNGRSFIFNICKDSLFWRAQGPLSVRWGPIYALKWSVCWCDSKRGRTFMDCPAGPLWATRCPQMSPGIWTTDALLGVLRVCGRGVFYTLKLSWGLLGIGLVMSLTDSPVQILEDLALVVQSHVEAFLRGAQGERERGF